MVLDQSSCDLCSRPAWMRLSCFFVWLRVCVSLQPSEASPRSTGSAVLRRPKVWTASMRGCLRGVTPSTAWAYRWAAWTWASLTGPTVTAIYSDGRTLTHAQTPSCCYTLTWHHIYRSLYIHEIYSYINTHKQHAAHTQTVVYTPDMHTHTHT